MRAGLDSGHAIKRVSGLVAGAAMVLAACSGPAATSAPSAAASAAASAPASAPAESPSAAANDEPLELAYISFAVANSYDAPMLAAAQAAAAANNANITVFDGALDPPTQVKQLQDAIRSEERRVGKECGGRVAADHQRRKAAGRSSRAGE